jgi:Zn-finger nucleic acid-binding protein
MNRVNFGRVSGVVLDVCRDDGLWFDQDELHRVVGFLQSGGLERGQRREHEARKAELERLRDSARDAALQAPSGWDARTGTLDLGRFLSSVLDLLDR